MKLQNFPIPEYWTTSAVVLIFVNQKKSYF